MGAFGVQAVVVILTVLAQYSDLAVSVGDRTPHTETLYVIADAVFPHDQCTDWRGVVVRPADDQAAVRLYPGPQAVGFGNLEQCLPGALTWFNLNAAPGLGLGGADFYLSNAQRLYDLVQDLRQRSFAHRYERCGTVDQGRRTVPPGNTHRDWWPGA